MQLPGIRLEYLLHAEQCVVPHCVGYAGAGRWFCRPCWLMLPSRSRRKLWRLFKSTGQLDGRAFWRLIAIRLAQRLEWATTENARLGARESLYQQVEMLQRAGLDLDTVNRMGLRIQELEAQLPGPFSR